MLFFFIQQSSYILYITISKGRTSARLLMAPLHRRSTQARLHPTLTDENGAPTLLFHKILIFSY